MMRRQICAWFTWAAACLAIGLVCIPVRGENGSRAAAESSAESYDWARWRQFWSFKAIERPELPHVEDESWVRNPIDRFVLARLEHEKLQPAPPADKLTLLRRVTFDTTGLPPTPQEIRAFLTDKSPDAYERVVDRLLASPHYGERWGRHWLDLARYVQGRITFPGVSHTLGDQAYRDYVVRSFNDDKPYDQFVIEQLAGDLLPPAADRQQEFDQITAPAFLSIGAWFDMCTDPNRLRLEMVDDMINTTSKAFLGLSVACARCHDHKFDPIPTSDYYALAGIFGSTRIVGDFSEYWRDGRQRLLRPLAMPDEVSANDAILKQAAQANSSRWKILADAHAALLDGWQGEESKYRNAADGLGHPWIKRWAAENFDGEHNLRIAQLSLNGQSVDVLETLMPAAQWVLYKVQVPEAGTYALEALYSTNDSTPVVATVNSGVARQNALGEPTGAWELTHQNWGLVCACDLNEGLNFIRLDLKQGYFPRLDRLRLWKVDKSVERRIDDIAAAGGLNRMLLADFVKDPQQPWPTIAGVVRYLQPDEQDRVRELGEQAAKLEASVKPYPTVVSVADQPRPIDEPVHVRGDVYNVTSEAVPRGVLRLFDTVEPRPQIAPQTSGRMELARWITDQRNPLTARVMVNRIWQHHFGRGIVNTPSDFGTRGDPPTHPELLDWLACELTGHRWSIKHIHRLILTSSTYRMSSRPYEDAAQRDPDNKLLSHFNRQRLEVEALYDSMASTTNSIVRQESGGPLDVEKDKNRAMYVLASNRSPKGLGPEVRKMFELFDYEGSGAPIAQRPQSTTPAQSLFWLNSPLVKHFAEHFSDRLLKMDKLSDPKRIEMAYMLALGRFPTKDESAQVLGYLRECSEQQGMNRPQSWASLCQALYGTVEFRYFE